MIEMNDEQRENKPVVPVPGPVPPSIIKAASELMSKCAVNVAQSGQCVETTTIELAAIPVTA